jgi:hypothetical protein
MQPLHHIIKQARAFHARIEALHKGAEAASAAATAAAVAAEAEGGGEQAA